MTKEKKQMMTQSQRLRKLAEMVIEASFSWTGEDEEKTPALKMARTMAGLAIKDTKPVINREVSDICGCDACENCQQNDNNNCSSCPGDTDNWLEVFIKLQHREIPKKNMPRLLFDCLNYLFSTQAKITDLQDDISSVVQKLQSINEVLVLITKDFFNNQQGENDGKK